MSRQWGALYISTYPRCAEILSYHLKTAVEVSKKLLIEEPNVNLKTAYLKANSFEFESQVEETLQAKVSQDLVDRLPKDPWIVRHAWYRALIRYALTVVIPQEANKEDGLIYFKELLIQYVQNSKEDPPPFLGLIVDHNLVVTCSMPDGTSQEWQSLVHNYAYEQLINLIKAGGIQTFLEALTFASSETKESWKEVQSIVASGKAITRKGQKERLETKKGRKPKDKRHLEKKVLKAVVSFLKERPSTRPTKALIAHKLNIKPGSFPTMLQRNEIDWKEVINKAKHSIFKTDTK
ncbi:MAG: hypothetical protein HY774_03130 [Acidobacteria bacterium]|nr:hypothetical protein [Acidobacteriota bacterium]